MAAKTKGASHDSECHRMRSSKAPPQSLRQACACAPLGCTRSICTREVRVVIAGVKMRGGEVEDA